MKRFKNYSLMVGSLIIGTLFCIMLLSIFWTPYDPYLIDETNKLALPSLKHPLGTDYLGRDLLSRVMVASQTAFYVGVISVLIGGVLGVFFGTLSGYFGGVIDIVISKIVEGFISIPSILFLLLFIAVVGKDVTNTAIAIGILNIPTFLRMSRSKTMEIKSRGYITWAKVIGVPNHRILFVHLLPNILSVVIIVGAMSFSSAILVEASLSYLGMGVNPPRPSWGEIIYRAKDYILVNPYYAVVPGILISLVAIGFNLLGEGIKENLNR